MASYNDLVGHIEKALELEDARTVALMNPAINFAIWLATVLFEPAEQQVVQNQVVTSTSDVITMSLTRMLRVDHIYNQTGACPMWPMTYDQLRAAYVPAGNATYYAIVGNKLYYKPTPTASQTVNCSILQYPARVVSGGNLPFDSYQDFILSTAIQFMWATQEETENVDMWIKLGNSLGVAGTVLELTKQIMQRSGMDVNNLSRVIPKGTSPTQQL